MFRLAFWFLLRFITNVFLGAIALVLLYNLVILLNLRWILFPIDFVFLKAHGLLIDFFQIVPERDIIATGFTFIIMWSVYAWLVGVLVQRMFATLKCSCPMDDRRVETVKSEEK